MPLGVKISPASGAALSMVNLPVASTPINASAFAGDGGESYVRGIAAGQALVEPVAKGVLTAIEYNKPENVKKRELEAALLNAQIENLPTDQALKKAQTQAALAEAQFNLALLGGDAAKKTQEQRDLQLQNLRDQQKKVQLEIESLTNKNTVDKITAPTAEDVQKKKELENKLNDLKLQEAQFDQNVLTGTGTGGALDGIDMEALRRARIKKKFGLPDNRQKAVEEGIKTLMASGRYRDGMTDEEVLKAAGAGTVYTKDQITAANQLRDDFNKDKSIEKAVAAEGALQVILKGLDEQTGAGDIAAINQFQSGMVDPGATVREGDVALMKSASPLLAELKAKIPRLIKGGQLSPEMREQIRKLAIGIAKERATHANDTIVPQYEKLATKSGVQFDDVGRKFKTDFGPAKPVMNYTPEQINKMRLLIQNASATEKPETIAAAKKIVEAYDAASK